MKIKVCGMKYMDNILSVADLQPDYMGYIFYERSKRHFNADIPALNPSIKKTGVFVNSSMSEIIRKIKKYDLKAVQLHGDETFSFCEELKKNMDSDIELIKAFSISEEFNFDTLSSYQEVCDYYLFDTKGQDRGGNGLLFNWNLLNKFHHHKKFFLSGGIGIEELKMLSEFRQTEAGRYCYAIDLNSKFESEPGLKITEQLEAFFKQIEKQN